MNPRTLAVMLVIIILGAACGNRTVSKEINTVRTADPRLAKAETALAVLPAETGARVKVALHANPAAFFQLLEDAEKESAKAGDLLVLVDKKHSLPADFEPADLVSLNDYDLTVSRNDLRLRLAIMEAVLAMDAAAKADGLTLEFSSSYRSFEYQDGLFKRYVASHGEAEASRFSARAGTSQHQLGTAIDFGSIDDTFADTDAGRWLAQNAWRFGFSMSYPRNMENVTGYIWESWHFRYITKAGAALEKNYFDGIQQYLLEFIAAWRQG
jgi:D-alanyl-D-alanine carboxypeptidase